MGIFLSLSSVVGKSKDQVIEVLSRYATEQGGGLVEEDLPANNDHCCVIAEAAGNCTLFNPHAFMDWDDSARYLSTYLQAPVFSFHIHDGDFWMYILFSNGEEVDQFNPIPDYFDENIGAEEINAWKGNSSVIAKLVPYIAIDRIEEYLVRWDLEAESPPKAYPDDEFVQEDWQLLDFMRALNLPYPLKDDGMPVGQTFRFWTKSLPMVAASGNQSSPSQIAMPGRKRPWWKFW